MRHSGKVCQWIISFCGRHRTTRKREARVPAKGVRGWRGQGGVGAGSGAIAVRCVDTRGERAEGRWRCSVGEVAVDSVDLYRLNRGEPVVRLGATERMAMSG